MKKFTMKEKVNGEMAARNLSEKAFKFYSETDPLTIYEYETENGKRYAYDFSGTIVSDLTFSELENDFIDLYNEFNELLN